MRRVGRQALGLAICVSLLSSCTPSFEGPWQPGACMGFGREGVRPSLVGSSAVIMLLFREEPAMPDSIVEGEPSFVEGKSNGRTGRSCRELGAVDSISPTLKTTWEAEGGFLEYQYQDYSIEYSAVGAWTETGTMRVVGGDIELTNPDRVGSTVTVESFDVLFDFEDEQFSCCEDD